MNLGYRVGGFGHRSIAGVQKSVGPSVHLVVLLAC